MDLKISSGKSRFIVKESLLFQLEIRNNGSAPIKVPAIADSRNKALVYELTGPSVPDGLRFDYGSASYFRLPGDPETEDLEPGKVLSESVDVTSFVRIWKPGRHSIRIRLGDSVSPAFEFEITPPSIKSAQVLSEGTEMTLGTMRIAFLEGAGNVYLGFYTEPDGVVETPAESKFVQVATLPAEAREIDVPWTNFNRGNVFFSRYGWRVDGRFGVDEATPEERVQLDLNGAKIAGPPLMTESGDIQLFTYRGREVAQWTVPRHKSGSARRLWTVELPGEAVSGSAVLGAKNMGSPAAGVFVIPGQDWITVAVVRDGKVQLGVEKVSAIPGSVPAVALPARDVVYASVIAAASADLKEAVVVDVLWDPRRPKAIVTKGSPQKLPAKPISAATAYCPFGDAPRRDWVIAFADGQNINSRSHGEVHKFGSAPVLPLQLVARARETYMLVFQPESVFDLALLH